MGCAGVRPAQTEFTPSGCRWCGVAKHDHLQRWTAQAGWHTWAPPTQEQIKTRMRARAAARAAGATR
ncbi:hypothetical protein DQ384_26105 [Sphaerisporangium album]|uniref:Uncharacterized protein n=2 Tax=Sphaerisporangium album TaxID=509200 RepID=A0A367FAI2_9ACTN|nr:hypothetical protein DQ384_26105 [Sphaerisporangium album]